MIKKNHLCNIMSLLGIIGIIGIIGCEDYYGTQPSSKEKVNTLEGFWFACEFDDCLILDDDGYHFTSNGEIYYVEEATQNSESECGGSPCFWADQESISVDRGLVGEYTYSNGSLKITIDSYYGGCDELIPWNTSADFFEPQSSCLPFQTSLVKKFSGQVYY
jgi:hypothetical protein